MKTEATIVQEHDGVYLYAFGRRVRLPFEVVYATLFSAPDRCRCEFSGIVQAYKPETAEIVSVSGDGVYSVHGIVPLTEEGVLEGIKFARAIGAYLILAPDGTIDPSAFGTVEDMLNEGYDLADVFVDA